VQDAEALADEEHVPDRIEERHGALDRGSGHDLALDGGEFVTQFGHALLELVVALVELGEALGGHVAAGFAATDGLQHALALLAAALLFGSELRQLLLERWSTPGVRLMVTATRARPDTISSGVHAIITGSTRLMIRLWRSSRTGKPR
jgi:hypothetical protein